MQSKKESWLGHCIEELKLPGSPWHEVHNLISERLAYRIKLEGLTYEQLDKVSQFVGKDFIKKYKLYESLDYSSDLNLSSTRLLTDEEVQQLLKDLTLKAARDAECSLPLSSSADQNFIETIDLINSVYQNIITKTSRLDSKTSNVENLANAVVDILQSDPGKVDDVVTSMKGRCMPIELRKYLYRLILLTKRKSSPAMRDASHQRHFGAAFSNDFELNQKQIRERFAESVKHGMLELQLKKPTETRLAHLIRSSVIETFECNEGLRSYSDSIAFQKEACRVLNILYTCKKNFEHAYTLWLFPLQISLSRKKFVKEGDYELAMWLDLLVTEVVLPWPIINQIVFSAWFKALKFSQNSSAFQDVDLVTILISLGVSIEENVTEKLLQKNEYSRSTQSTSVSSLESQYHNKQSHTSLQTDYSHPVLCIRQWIVQLFVGFTSVPTTMFIWDQLFLNGWSQQCFKRVCLVLIYCLATNIAMCKTSSDLLVTFSQETCAIEVRAVVSAWKKINDLFPL